jgi:glycosidase
MKVYFDIITNHTADVISYQENQFGYVPKDDFEYRDADGIEFDDKDYAGTGTFPALDPEVSFPYTPFVPAGLPHKVPEWLNDVTLYHNRGDTNFTGLENPLYGDFFGLDDLFTEHPDVVEGMIDIYKTWIEDFRIDGFRIDTMKHVNDVFWQQVGPEILDFAHDQGLDRFYMFGEVFDTESKAFTARFTTRDKMQAILDFPFQARAQDFAANSGSAARLKRFFEDDDVYTDADSNVYQLPTFLGNHDMGRIGRFVQIANQGAPDSELFARDRLAHELMYFSRGNPVIYYGDEQGFTGDGGDQLARQDMFPSQVAEYNVDDLIGTDATTAESNFDTGHPLFQSIARLAHLTQQHKALRDGAHQNRYADDGPGIYAFSRIGARQRSEYVVALNDSEAAKTASIPTFADGTRTFFKLYGSGAARLRSDADGDLGVSVAPLSAVVYRLAGKLPLSKRAPSISIASAQQYAQDHGRLEVRADVGGDDFYEVTFQAKVGGGGWENIGTDDTAPYRVFHDVAGHPTGTDVAYRATVRDNAGHTRTSSALAAEVPAPAITLLAPANGAHVRGSVRLEAAADPDRADQSVRFERRLAGGDWTTVGSDTSWPLYVVVDDISGLGLADGDTIEYRAVLIEGGGNEVISSTRTVSAAIDLITSATIHYFRPAGDYADWGLHLFGGAIDFSVDWGAPFQPTGGPDGDGLVFDIPVVDDTQNLCFIIHKPFGDQVPETREPGGDQCFRPIDHEEVWMIAGDPTQHYADPTP